MKIFCCRGGGGTGDAVGCGGVGVLVRNPIPEVGHHRSCSLGQDGRSGNTEQIALKPTA